MPGGIIPEKVELQELAKKIIIEPMFPFAIEIPAQYFEIFVSSPEDLGNLREALIRTFKLLDLEFKIIVKEIV